MNRILSILFMSIYISCTPTIGQEIVTRKNAPKKSLKIYKQALSDANREEGVDKAIKKLEKLVNKMPNFLDARLFLGTLYSEKENYTAAVNQFKEVIKIKPDYKIRVYYALGRTYEKMTAYDAALKSYETYINHKKAKSILVKKCKKAIKNIHFRREALAHPVNFDPKKLDKTINTGAKEYLPFITADGKEMIFTRRAKDENFYSSIFKDGKWSEPSYLNSINTDQNEGAHTLSPDGKVLYYTFCDDHVTMGSCDIYFTKKKNGQWQKPKNLGRNINSTAWDSQPTLSADGQTLYFVSKRKGGYGGSDIWYSRKKRGVWQKPKNAGDIINTEEDEMTPFLHPDGQTLYFSSNGHPGMGGKDIFLTRRDTEGHWGIPKNLGYPINTEDGEADLFVDLHGHKAYFAKDYLKDGNIDIYSFLLPNHLQPQNVLYIKGQVKNKDSQRPLPAYIKINQVKGNYALKVKTDNKGDYLVCLPMGYEYTFNVSKKGYIFYSERLNIPMTVYLDSYIKDIELSPIKEENVNEVIKKEEPIVLNNVLFKSGSYKLLPVSTYELNNLVQLMKDLPKINILITGHTDNVGETKANQILSENRAKSVVEYLEHKGIEPSRLKYEGKGETQPIDNNDNEIGRNNNRRTTFRIN